MTQLTPNLQLKKYDRVADKTQLFIDYRDDQAGTGSTSNMSKIDAFAGNIENEVTNLKGTGWTNQTVKNNYDLIQATNQRVTYTTTLTGTDTLVGTISELTSVQNNTTIKIIPTAFNTGAVTLNINGYGALPIQKVQNQTGSTIYASLSAKDLQPNQPVYITKSPDGIRYIYIGLENYARNIYYENGTNDYTNLQTKLADMVTLAGTQVLTNKTLTAPKISSGSAIADVNGNELIKFPTTVASAVNEITVTNSVTTVAPKISATGTDTNIDLNLESKGAGVVKVNTYPVVFNNPSVTTFVTGFPVGWTGSIVVIKNNSTDAQIVINLTSPSGVPLGTTNLFTLPLELRPRAVVSIPVELLLVGGEISLNSKAYLYIQTDGNVFLKTSGTMTNTKDLFCVTLKYYTF